MKFDQLVHIASGLPWFDLAMVTQLSSEPKRQLTMQLNQWVRAAKVLPLRRGLYTMADPFRKVSVSPLALANTLVYPSYLTSIWALGYYGLVPEKVAVYTSATTRGTREFQNFVGTFAYASLKPNFFWGFSAQKVDQQEVWIADPEKALLDYWHLSPGEWTTERLTEMRFQNTNPLNDQKLTRYAEQWDSPRLLRAKNRFVTLMRADEKGYRTL